MKVQALGYEQLLIVIPLLSLVYLSQDENTPFCPNMIRSHFVHSYIVVQVEHPNTDHTVYKVRAQHSEYFRVASLPDLPHLQFLIACSIRLKTEGC